MSSIFETVQHLFVFVAATVLAAISFITPGHKVESPPKPPPTAILPSVLGESKTVTASKSSSDKASNESSNKILKVLPTSDLVTPSAPQLPPISQTLTYPPPTAQIPPAPATVPPSPVPTITPTPIPAATITPPPNPVLTPSPSPQQQTTVDNAQISFRVYWETSHGARPLADYSSSVCLGDLDVVWAHFFLIDPSAQEQNIGNQDYRQKPCGVLNAIGYPLTGKPLGEYTLKVVFDELGVTKTAKATLGPPQI